MTNLNQKSINLNFILILLIISINTIYSQEFTQFKKFTKLDMFINTVTIQPNAKNIAVGTSEGIIYIYNNLGICIDSLKGHKEYITSMVYSKSGNFLVSGSDDKTIRLWDSLGKNILIINSKSPVNTTAISPDEQYIASGHEDNIVRLWNFKGELLHELKQHLGRINTVAFSPNSQNVISGASEDNTIKIWNLEGECINTLKGHTGRVFKVSISTDGNYIVSGSRDKTVKIWEYNTGKCLKTLFGHKDYVSKVKFTPDLKNVISSSYDKTIKIWDFKTGKCIQTIKEPNGDISALDLSNDGKFLVSSEFYSVKNVNKSDITIFKLNNKQKEKTVIVENTIK